MIPCLAGSSGSKFAHILWEQCEVKGRGACMQAISSAAGLVRPTLPAPAALLCRGAAPAPPEHHVQMSQWPHGSAKHVCQPLTYTQRNTSAASEPVTVTHSLAVVPLPQMLLDLVFRRLYVDPTNVEGEFSYDGLLKIIRKVDKVCCATAILPITCAW